MRAATRFVATLFLLFHVVSFCASAAAAPRSSGSAHTITPFVPQWLQFRFDQNRTGFNRFEHVLSPANVPALGLAWQAQLGRRVVYSSPTIANGVLYMASTDGTLWAYPADGCGSDFCSTPLWQSVTIAQIIDSPTVADGIVYVGSQTSADSNDGLLNAFDARGCGAPVCAPLWQGAVGKDAIVESTPAVGNGFVFVGAYDGRMYAFNARGCGKAICDPVWAGVTGNSIESSPTVSGGVVYIGSNDGHLYAFPATGCGRRTCPPLWTADLGNPAFSSSPAVANGVVYIGSAHTLSAFDARGCGAPTCAPLWQAEDDIDFFNGSPAVAYGRVYIGLETGLAAYAADGCGQAVCDPLWLLFGTGFQAAVESSPTVANGVVYAARNTGQVLAWSADPCGSIVCDEIWSASLGDQLANSSPAVINGRLYVGGTDDLFPEDTQGRVYVFELP